MVDGDAAFVALPEQKTRARGHIISGQGGGQATDEGSFAAADGAAEGDHVAAAQTERKALREKLRVM